MKNTYRSVKAFGYLMMLVAWCAPGYTSANPSSGPRDVIFTADCDGSEQHYVVLLPRRFDSSKPHDLMIALHGHGSDRWQFVRDTRDECRAARDAATAHQMIFVAPDYRAKTSWMGIKAETDMVQMIGQLKTEYSIRDVLLVGGSMGASSALSFAAMHPDLIDGVVAMNGTANHLEYEGFQKSIQQSFGGTKSEIPEQYKRRSAEYWPERLTMPIGITAGGRDRSVPPASVLRLANVLTQIGHPVLVVYREQCGHSTGYEDGKRVLDFVIGHMRVSPTNGRVGKNRTK